MAVLAIGLASAAATSAAGYAGYSALAYSVATTIASQYFKKGQSSEGPRLSDLAVTISSYGTVIPQIFGTIRQSGNMIWSTNIKETKHKKKVGGKGGFGKATQTTYSYSISCAFLLCENEISGIRRIWSNGEIVYDVSETNNSISTSMSYSSMKIYKGTEDQMPDPTIEAIEGAGNVEAYRGCAYIVFDNLQLEQFGNALPNLTFEIVGEGANSTYSLSTVATNETFVSSTFFDNDLQKFVRVIRSNDDTKFFITDLYNNTTITKSFPFNGFSYNTNRINKVQSNYAIPGFSNQKNIAVLDSSFNFVSNIDLTTFNNYSSSNSFVESLIFNEYNQNAYGLGYINKILCMSEIKSLQQISTIKNNFLYFDVKEKNWSRSDLSFDNSKVLGNSNAGIITDGTSIYFLYSYSGSGNNNTTDIYKIDITTNIITLEATLNNITYNRIYCPVFYYDEISNSIIVSGSNDSLPTSRKRTIVKYNLDTKQQQQFNINDVFPEYILNGNSNIFISEKRQIIFAQSTNGNNNFASLYINIDNFSDYVKNDQTIVGINFGDKFAYYNSEQQAFLSLASTGTGTQTYKVISDRLSTSGTFLSTVLRNLCKKSGLDDLDIDLTDVSDIAVRGYSLTNESSLRSIVEQLQIPFNFNVIESDFKLKFKKNLSNIVKVIDIKELGAMNYSPDMNFENDFTTVRQLEQDLPKRVDITYIDFDDDYNQNTQQAIRENVKTQTVASVELPVVLSANEAKEIVQRSLYDYYIQRSTYTFSMNYDHINLEAGDIIQIKDGDNLFTMKISKFDSDGGIIKVECVAYNSYIYDQYAIGANTQVQKNGLNVVSRSETYLLDLPLLTAEDFVGFYACSAPSASALKWSGSVLYSSSDNAEYSEKNSFFDAANVGFSTNILGNFTEGNTFDSYNSVTVTMSEELENATQEQVLNGANLALLGNEIIQFMNAELVGVRTYRLSGLLRGRYATEEYISNHMISEQFLILDRDTIQSVSQNAVLINNNMFYKNVTFNRTLNETSSLSFINRSNNQRTPSVENVQSSRNGSEDLNVNFIPRLRGLAYLQDYADSYDIDASAGYQIDIKNSSGTVLRTISSSTTNFTYSSANQITDFGSNQSSINIDIYKMNAVIGRGKVRSVTL